MNGDSLYFISSIVDALVNLKNVLLKYTLCFINYALFKTSSLLSKLVPIIIYIKLVILWRTYMLYINVWLSDGLTKRANTFSLNIIPKITIFIIVFKYFCTYFKWNLNLHSTSCTKLLLNCQNEHVNCDDLSKWSFKASKGFVHTVPDWRRKLYKNKLIVL